MEPKEQKFEIVIRDQEGNEEKFETTDFILIMQDREGATQYFKARPEFIVALYCSNFVGDKAIEQMAKGLFEKAGI